MTRREIPSWVVCYEHRGSTPGCATQQEMREWPFELDDQEQSPSSCELVKRSYERTEVASL